MKRNNCGATEIILEKKQIFVSEANLLTSKEIFISGGGANLKNLKEYCSEFFGSKVTKLPENQKKNTEDEKNVIFASCLGALKIIKDGWETEAIPKDANKFGKKPTFFDKIFRYKA